MRFSGDSDDPVRPFGPDAHPPARLKTRARRPVFAQPRRTAERGIEPSGGRALLPCYPWLFGFTFDPRSVDVCYRAGGAMAE
jgi:hypothetical protein